MNKISQFVGSAILGVGLLSCASEESNSANNKVKPGIVTVEVVNKETISGDSPKCKLHFQFSSGLNQKVKAQITSYQVLDAKQLTFGMTGKKSMEPNSKSRISPIKTNSACKDVMNIAVERAKCDLVDDQKNVLGSCADKLELISNDLITFTDKRK